MTATVPVGEQLRAWRERRGLSQLAVSSPLSLTRSISMGKKFLLLRARLTSLKPTPSSVTISSVRWLGM